MIYSIANEYSKTPGGRFIHEGACSGEDFRKTVLKPLYLKCKENGEELAVDLDGGYGYATSFLEEAFGGLVRELKDPGVRKIKIISTEEPALVERVDQYITDALRREGLWTN